MMSRKACIFGFLAIFLLPSLSPGQTTYVMDDAVTGNASGTLYSAIVPLSFPRSYLFARGDFGDRPGVEDNYFATGGFMPMQMVPDQVFFLEGQVWITEQNEKSIVGGNFGFGNRWYINDYGQAVGVNAFASWDQTGTGNNYDGAGIGLEFLSDYLSATANAYIPWKNRRINPLGPAVAQKDDSFFTGPNLAFRTLQPVEEQLKGIDLEIGTAIPRAEWLSVHGGVYHFDAAQDNDFTGVSGRVQMDFTNAIVNVTVSDDDAFGTSVNVTGELRVGDGRLNFTPRFRNLDTQMFDRVRRRTRIATLQYLFKGQELAINPATGLPFNFIHVDNTAAPGGDGTFENRFNELDLASNMPQADIILAYRGDTTFGGNHLDANNGLQLEDNQIVVGQGYNFLIETQQFLGQFCPLPDFGDGGINPYIDGNPNASLISLANNNQILGLNVIAPNGGNAISGNGITDFIIDEINRDINFGVENTGDGAGIVLTDVMGTGTITNVGFDIQDPAAAGGIVINNTNTGDLNVMIDNDLTTFPGLVVMGGQVGVGIAADNSNINAQIDEILNTGSGTGLDIDATNGGQVTANVTNSAFNDTTTGNGIDVNADTAGNVLLTATNTSATGAAQDGLGVTLDNATGALAFEDSTFANAGDDAIDINLNNNAVLNVMLENTSGNNATDDGIVGVLDNNSTLIIVGTDSTFTDAQNGDGLDITATNMSTFGGNFTDGSFADAGGNAVSLDFDGLGTLGILQLDNVSLDRAGLNGLNVTSDNDAIVQVDGNEISAANAGVDAIHLDTDNGAFIGVTLTEAGSFADAGEDGIDITNANGGSVILTGTGTMGAPIDFSGAQTGNGLIANSSGMGTITDIDFLTGANFDNAGIDAINITSDSAALTTFDGTAVSGANAGDDGIDLNSDGGTIAFTITEAGSFANAGTALGGTGDGIDVTNINGGQVGVSLTGAGGAPIDFTNAEQNGLLSSSDGMGTVTTFNFNSGAMFDMAGNDAIQINSDNGAITSLTATDLSGSMAGDDGIDLNADAGTIAFTAVNTGDFSGANSDGIEFTGNNGAVIGINVSGTAMTPANFSMAGDNGIRGSLNGSVGTLTIDQANFNNAGIDGMFVDVTNVSTFTANITNTTFNNAMTGDGIDIQNNGSMSTVNLTNVEAMNAAQNGLELTAGDSIPVGSSILDVNLNNVNLNNSTMSAIWGRALEGALLDIDGTDVSGASAGASAIDLMANSAQIDLTLDSTGTNDFTLSGMDGIRFNGVNSSTINIDISESNFDDAAMAGTGFGVQGTLTDSTGTLNLDNSTFNNAAISGIGLVAVNSTLSGTWTGVSANNAGLDAINIGAAGASDVDFTIDMFSGTMAGADGFDINTDGMMTDVNIQIDNSDFSNAGDNGLEFDFTNSSNITFNSDGGLIVNMAGNDSLNLFGDTLATADIDLTDASLLPAFDDMTDATIMGGAFADVLIDPTPATGAGDNGLEFNVNTGGTFNFTLIDSPLSTEMDPVGNNGVLGVIDNGTVNLTFTNSDIDNSLMGGATGDGINVTGSNGSSLTLNLNNSSVDNWNGGSGLVLQANDPMTNFIVNASNTSFDNAGTYGADIQALNGASVVLNIDNFSADGNGVGGLNLLADGMGSSMSGSITNGTTQDNGAAGIDGSFGIQINALNGAVIGDPVAGTAGLFFGGIASGNTDPMNLTQDHGILSLVDNDAYMNLLFDDVHFDFNESHGAVFNVNEPATGGLDTAFAVLTIQNSTINENTGNGLVLLATDGNFNPANQQAGILATIIDTEIKFNANAPGLLPHPIDPGLVPDAAADGDDVGYGLFAVADNNIITVNLSGVDLGDNEEGSIGPNPNAINGGVFNLNLANMDIFDPVQVCADGAGSFATITLTNINIFGDMFADPNDAAISIRATGGGQATGTFNNIGIFNVQAQALAFLSDGVGSSVIADFNGLTIDTVAQNAGLTDSKTGLMVDAVLQGAVRNGATADIDLTGVTINNTGVNGGGPTVVNALDMDAETGGTLDLQIDGMIVQDTMAQLAEGEIDVTTDANINSHAIIDFNNINVDGGDQIGINLLNAPLGGTMDIVQLNNISADNTGGLGFQFFGGLNDTDGIVTLSNSSFDGSAGVTINALGMTSDTTFNIDNVTGDGAGLTLVAQNLTSMQNADVNITGSSFDNAAGVGIDVTLAGVADSTGNVNITNTTATGAGVDGILILNLGTDVGTVNIDTVDVSGAANHGVHTVLSDQTTPTNVLIDNLTANDTGDLGALIDLDNITGSSTISITNSDLINTDPMNITGGGILLDLDNVSGGTQTITIDNVTSQNSQIADSLEIDVDGLAMNDIVDLSITNSDFSGDPILRSGGDGVDIDINGVLGNNNTINLNIDGLTAQNTGGDGLRFAVENGETVNINNLSNVLVQNNAGDGIDFRFENQNNVIFNPMVTFSSVNSINNDQNGWLIEVAGGSTVSPLALDGIDLSNNATAGAGFDGLDIRVHGAGSTATFDFSNLTVNNSQGRGVDLDVYNGGDLTFNINGGTLDSNGLQGLDINVGTDDEFMIPPTFPNTMGTFNGTFTNVDITNSGQFPTSTADGVNAIITGMGTVANITFDDVVSNFSDEDGFDIDVINGATAVITVQNGTTALSNGFNAAGGTGFDFLADGMNTTASLIMDSSMAMNNFSLNEDEGILVQLTNGVTAPIIQLDATASLNGGDGIRVEANDNTGVTINSLDIAGALADNNMGNGLVVDLFNVLGINSFSLTNASFTGNLGDQVFLGFREQDLTDFTVENVTVVGAPGSGDGLEINMIDSNVTNLMEIRNLVATDNGERGLNLILDEAVIYDGIQTSSINTAYITMSEFARNGLAGARLLFGGESTANFDIFDNTAGFHDNTGIGLNIQVTDTATFTMEGDNFIDNITDPMIPEQSFYNNTIANNGSFGFLLEASEPDDNDALDFDEPFGGPPTLGPTYILALGDALRNPNVITGNTDAAMAIIGSNDSVGTFEIRNSLLTNTVDGIDARFNGDGLAILLENRAILTDLMLDGTTSQLNLNNNAGSGLFTNVEDDSMLGTVSRMTVLATTIQGNDMHGIDIQRADNGLYGPDSSNNQIIIGGLTDAEGNVLLNNTLNGLNIDIDNTAVDPRPFDLQVRSNTFMGNQDGIFARATADAQFSGRFSDNTFMGQTRDGIHIVLENDAALGNPTLATNPGMDPFLMDGNQILTSARNGIFFDTNFTNENGNFGGSASVNVLIQDSETRDDQFMRSVRTLISGNGANGIHIIDNSQFLGNMSTVMQQNTYDIRGTDIMMNALDGILVEQGERTDPAGPSDGPTRDLNNGLALLLGRPFGTSEFIGKRDVVISGNGDDGIDLELRDGDQIQNLFNMDLVSLIGNGANGDNQRNELGPQNVGHGLEVEVGEGNLNLQNDRGLLIANFNNVDVLQNFGDGMDFIVSSLVNTNVTDVTMFDVNSSMNGGRGLDVHLRHDNRQTLGGNSGATSFWRIGRGDNAFNLALTNQFNSNTREGVVFDLSARNMDPRDVPRGGNYPHQGHVDINNDVFVEVNGPNNLNLLNGPLHLPSTQHSGVTQGTLGIDIPPSVTSDIDGTGVHVNTFIQVVNTEIASNGGFGGFEDGLDIAVGALTRANVIIGNASFGGNRGDDIRIYPQESRLDNGTRIILPIGPTANTSSFADAGNDGGHSYVVYDPVAYIDLAFGIVDSAGGWQPDTTAGNGEAATSATGGGGNGDQVTFLTLGTQQTDQITFDGIFNQADEVKPDSRNVRLAGVVAGATINPITFVGGGSDDNSNNVFIENAVQQDINALFFNTNWIQYISFDPDGNGFPVNNFFPIPGGGNGPLGY